MKDYYKMIQSEKCRKDVTGKRFGSLIVNEMIYETNKHTRVRCTCDCGNHIETFLTYLTSGDTTSCGCAQRERTSEANRKDFTGVISDYGVELLSADHKNDRGVWMWKCKCPCCEGEFIALPAKVLNGHITSCGCAKRSSRERMIESFLSDHDISYEREYIFYDCKNHHPLRYDFYLPSKNTVIEYQGQQHYRVVPQWGGEDGLKHRKENDSIKREYCASNGIQLIELPFNLSDKEIKNKILNVINP